jgi:hypothetical protein
MRGGSADSDELWRAHRAWELRTQRQVYAHIRYFSCKQVNRGGGTFTVPPQLKFLVIWIRESNCKAAEQAKTDVARKWGQKDGGKIMRIADLRFEISKG